METIKTLAHHVITAISLVTACGVFVHDGRLDKAATTALNQPFSGPVQISMNQRFKDFVAADAHTHPDHNAAKAGLLNSFTYRSPSIPPRDQEQKKHLLQRAEPRGRHAFDNYFLPVIS